MVVTSSHEASRRVSFPWFILIRRYCDLKFRLQHLLININQITTSPYQYKPGEILHCHADAVLQLNSTMISKNYPMKLNILPGIGRNVVRNMDTYVIDHRQSRGLPRFNTTSPRNGASHIPHPSSYFIPRDPLNCFTPRT